MSVSVPSITAAELAMRLALRHDAGDWLALVVPAQGHVVEVAAELLEELQATGACPVAAISCPSDADDFIRQLQAHPDEVLLVWDVETFAEAEWQHIDLRRSELARSLCVVLIGSRSALERMLDAAPNLASWLSGSLWTWQADEISAEETCRRLQALRDATSQSDEEVLHLAQADQLPRDPVYAEWLILLGRGDLL